MDNSSSSDRVRPRILLADDSESFRRQVLQLLRKQTDLEVVGEAWDGDEALRLTGLLQPDVVIMDVLMPGMNGIEATRRITCEFPSIKVIALSMYGDDGFRRAMLDAGAAIYLLKDDVRNTLYGAIRSIIADTV